MNELLKDVEIAQSWRDGMELMRSNIASDKWMRADEHVLCSHKMLFRDIANNSDYEREIWETPTRCFKGVRLPKVYEPGYVYLLHADNHLFKIGKSNNPDRRFDEIGILVPSKISLVHAAFTDSMSFFERFLHSCFDDRRVRGEWFRLSFWDFLFFHQTHYNPFLLLDMSDNSKEKALFDSFASIASDLGVKYSSPWGGDRQ